MFDTQFHPESCNRRDFITAAGVLVAGGILSCSRDERGGEERSTKQLLPLPTSPITVRVRVGKIRQTATCSVDGKNISHGDWLWKLNNLPVTMVESNNNQVAWIHGQTHTIRVSEKTKTVTGGLSLHPRGDVSTHAFDIVAHVPMETYLPGVIAGELFSHWHPNTFAAQAVAARSYATVQHLKRKTSSHFDVTDGPSSQVFLGDVTLDVAHRGVSETKGIVLKWNNGVVPAYYSACCGGYAATASDAISNSLVHNIEPLQGRSGKDVCTSLPIHKWSVERPHRHLRNRLTTWSNTTTDQPLKQLRSIQSISSAQTNEHGRPTKLEIVDRRNRTHVMDANQFVRAANTSFSTLPNPGPRLWSSNLVATRAGSSVEISGVGMGHGVGLCQYGSQILAGKNKTWESILTWYYPNVTLDTLHT